METREPVHNRISTLLSTSYVTWRTWLPSRGNVIFTLVIIFVMFWAQSAHALPWTNLPATANSTTIWPYQGRLNNSAGVPLTAAVPMTFKLYSTPNGGTILWEEQWANVQVTGGLFNVILGNQTTIPQSIVNNSNLWLGITVGTDSEMTPRIQLGSVPFAGQAQLVPDGSITSAKLNFRVPKLLGQKSCDDCGDVTETLIHGLNPVKGKNAQDIIETTVITDGGPVFAQVTMRRVTTTDSSGFCFIRIYNDVGTIVRDVNVGGNATPMTDWACSSGYLFLDLPAGTYRFQLMTWGQVTSATWEDERQIVVFQY